MLRSVVYMHRRVDRNSVGIVDSFARVYSEIINDILVVFTVIFSGIKNGEI